jgi:hypothetical protein
MPAVEHSISTGGGTRAVAAKTGIEIRTQVNGLNPEEIVCLVPWKSIDHLRALVLDQR